MAPKPRLRTQVAAFVAVRTVLNSMHRMFYPFLLVFGRGLGVDLTALSLALFLRGFAGALGPFLAPIADRRGRKAGMLIGLVLFSAGAGLVALWPSFLTFIAALILAALGKYLFDPSMQAYLGDKVAYEQRGLVLAISELGWSLGSLVGLPLIGLLIARRGWIAPFPVLALAGLLSLGVLAWLLPRDPQPAQNQSGLFHNLRSVLAYAPALAGLVMGFFLSLANEQVNVIFGAWMEDAFGLKVAALGAATIVIGLAELGGASLAAGLVDRLGKQRAIAIGLSLNCIAALALPWLGARLAGAFAGLFLFYLTFEFTVVSSFPLMTEVMPAARATLMAANVAGMSLARGLGAFTATQLYTLGMPANVAAVVLFNLAALLALRRLWRFGESVPGESRL